MVVWTFPGGRRRRRTRTAWRVAAVLTALALASAACSDPAGPPPEEPPPSAEAVAPPTGEAPAEPPPVPPNWPRWGVTHTQNSADNEPENVAGELTRVLAQAPMLQNQHIMGFGAGNPEPSPGQYQWRDLDSRITLMDRSGGLPVITLCCAPDWMKGGRPGTTDWSRLTAAPKPEHFDDFAKLSAEVAKRYPHIRHYLVWNEFKGFYDPETRRPDAVAYTELYNKVYTALKQVNPDIQVGGPYIPINSHKEGTDRRIHGPWGVVDPHSLDAVEYWLENKRGADFIVVDGASVTEEHVQIPDEFGAVGKFGAVTRWLREKSGNLPVWWAEWYISPEETRWDEPHRLAVQAVSMMEFATSGAATALYWSPQRKSGDCPGCLWQPGEPTALPTYELIANFVRWFPADVELERVSSSSAAIRVIAQKNRMLMVNTTDEAVVAEVDGKTHRFAPYEIIWSDRAT